MIMDSRKPNRDVIHNVLFIFQFLTLVIVSINYANILMTGCS